MQAQPIAQRSAWRVVRLGILVLTALVMAACGAADEEDSGDSGGTPLALENETMDVADSDTPTPATGSPAASSSAGTPTAPLGSPAAGLATPGPAVSTPPITLPTTTPVAGASPAGTPEATPVAVMTPADAGPVGVSGDGTGGAGQSTGPTPEPPTEEVTSPADSIASALSALESCEVEFYPQYSGTSPTQVTTSQVNFRAGPGADCEEIGESIPAGTTVQVLSDPVTRQGDAENQWVAVLIDGTEGWLASQFLAPAP